MITTEGELWFLLNYAFDNPQIDELQDLLLSFGFWFDIGHSWSIGIYTDEGYDDRPISTNYKDLLSDIRWKRKAAYVKEKAGYRCQDCRNAEKRMEVHHCWYRYGLAPWQYPFDALRCLCCDCHKRRVAAEHDFRCISGEFTGPDPIRSVFLRQRRIRVTNG